MLPYVRAVSLISIPVMVRFTTGATDVPVTLNNTLVRVAAKYSGAGGAPTPPKRAVQ